MEEPNNVNIKSGEADGSVYEKQRRLMEGIGQGGGREPQGATEERGGNGRISILLARMKGMRHEVFIGILYALYAFMVIHNIMAYIRSVYYLSPDCYNLSLPVVAAELSAPVLTWVYSTKYVFYNFFRQKMLGLYLALANLFVWVAIFFEMLDFRLILPLVFRIPVGVSVTPQMVVALARVVTALFSSGLALAFAKVVFSGVSEAEMQKSILRFKVGRNADGQGSGQFAYDMRIIQRMEDGSAYVIKEKDRSLHTLVDGTTGTGKTSSCHTVAINGDFDQKIHNEDWQKKQLWKLLRKGEVRMARDFKDIDFSANYFVPAEGAGRRVQERLDEIRTLAASAGVTAMAPNAAFADEVYDLARMKGLRARRVDPMLADGGHKEGFIGFNPFYISPRLSGAEREIEVFSKSSLVADVLQAIFDQSGSSDPYFASLNQNATTTISSTLLLTYPSLHGGGQPTLKALQDILNDFPKIKPYRDELVRLYAVKRNPDGSPVMEPGRADIGNYQFLLDTIDNEFLGAGAAKMFDQARGLKIIVNTTLVNPLVRDVLCAEDSIDMDEMLADGQVTVINYALNLGSAGMAFGLFFMLSFIKAVIRRPGTEKTRLPHFFYVDEFPALLHKDEEMIFTYFRQFKTSAMVAIQTLDQMDKSKSTSFLRGVLVGNCAHQILFGRASVSEMEMYQKLAGKQMELQEMDGHTETALSMENTSYSMTHRESMQETDVLSANDIRMKDFQEVTVFSVSRNSAVPPFHGRVNFLPEYKRMGKKRKSYDWHRYFVPGEEEEETEMGGTDIRMTSVPAARTSVNEKERMGDFAASARDMEAMESGAGEKEASGAGNQTRPEGGLCILACPSPEKGKVGTPSPSGMPPKGDEEGIMTF